MALTITASDVSIVEVIEKSTGPTDEAVNAGQAARLSTTTGKFTKANGTTAAEARVLGIAVTTATVANEAITVVRKGILNVGDALDALAYDQDVYLDNTDGALGTVAGSVSTKIGRVVPLFGYTTADKGLLVDL
jgi:hypothetical protein